MLSFNLVRDVRKEVSVTFIKILQQLGQVINLDEPSCGGVVLGPQLHENFNVTWLHWQCKCVGHGKVSVTHNCDK